jgi:hypothetical protein
MRSRITGLTGSHSVAGRRFLEAGKRHDVAGKRLSTSARELACICSMRPMRSFLPFTVLSSETPLATLPE